MNPISVLIVDDEPLAREMLIDLVKADPELKVVGSAGNGHEGLKLVEQLSPEIVLFDIEMPGLDGLTAARHLSSDHDQPFFIFVTAHADYASEAFEVEAIDYVLKPVSLARLEESLERAKRRIRERLLSDVAQQVVSSTSQISKKNASAGVSDASKRAFLHRIPITENGRTRFIELSDVVWIESQDYYIKIHSRQSSPLLRASLKSLMDRLDPRKFFQIHRSAVVNLDAVKEVHSLFKGAHGVVLSSGQKLRVSRSRWNEFRRILAPSLRPK